MNQVYQSANQFKPGLSASNSKRKASSIKSSYSQAISDKYDPESDSPLFNFPSEKTNKLLSTPNLFMLLVIGALGCIYYNNRTILGAAGEELARLTEDFGDLRGLIRETANEIDAAHEIFSKMETTLLIDEHEDDTDDYYYYENDYSDEERKHVSQDIMEKHRNRSTEIEKLKKSIQALHLQELERRYGKGPYFVEFEVEIDGTTMYFTVETAPNELMPHSVFTFMQMVKDTVWDETVFIHNWKHIVQAAPISPDGLSKKDLSTYELSFPEYAEEYNHKKYTMGFAGRPGGPDFYINMLDNDESHGPGKQDHSRVLNDADPCFAKIVMGTNTFVRLQQYSDDAISRDKPHLTTIRSVRRITPSSAEILFEK